MSTLYTIAPLTWQEHVNEQGDKFIWAETIFGHLSIDCDDDGVLRFRWCVDEFYDEGSEIGESIDDCKARAWAWYLSRLTPALVEMTRLPELW